MVKDGFKFHLKLMTVIVKKLDRGCLDNLTNYYRFVGKRWFHKSCSWFFRLLGEYSLQAFHRF